MGKALDIGARLREQIVMVPRVCNVDAIPRSTVRMAVS